MSTTDPHVQDEKAQSAQGARTIEIQGAVLERIGDERPYAHSRPISVSTLRLAEPAAGEVLVRIEAASICHSDLSVVNGVRPRPTPMLLGHEAAGRIEAVGADVQEITVGQRVAMTFMPRCGECAGCATDGKMPCEAGTASNTKGELLSGGIRLERDGEVVYHHLGVSGFATHAVVDARSVVPVDDDVPPGIAALLGCAVLTGGGALLNAATPKPGDSVAVIGLGGVGLAALITAVSLGVERIIAIDMAADKLETARRLGAHETYTPEEAIDLGVRPNIVVEAAGHQTAFETAVRIAAPGGTTVTVGLPAPHARSSISPLSITAEAKTIIGSYLGSAVPKRDIPVYAQLWREGRLNVEGLISGTIALDDINEGMDALADGRAIRQIIVFDDSETNTGPPDARAAATTDSTAATTTEA